MTWKVYLAARYSRREELCRYRDHLAEIDWTVTSRWLNGNHQVADDGMTLPGTREEARRFCMEDLEDIDRAQLLIAFTEPPRSTASRGGRHVELGYALGRGMAVMVVGHQENVFCCHPLVEYFVDWESAVSQLRGNHGAFR